MASIEERFTAAVNVIKNLPKNGSYQPSTAMMLTFYGYFKQATEGPCHQKKPVFWDVVGKAKWDAWNANRHLSKERAMQLYVDELRKIIETMSYTENVADFVGSISELDSVNLNDLEVVAPGIMELAQSHPNSPFGSRTNSPQHGVSANFSTDTEKVEADPINGQCNGVVAEASSTNNNQSNPEMPIFRRHHQSNGTLEQSDDEYGDPVDMQSEFNEAIKQNSELLKQIQATVLRMNADLLTVNQRMNSLEKTVKDLRSIVQKQMLNSSASFNWSRSHPKWWPFDDISPTWFIILVLWPFLINRLSRMLVKQRRK